MLDSNFGPKALRGGRLRAPRGRVNEPHFFRTASPPVLYDEQTEKLIERNGKLTPPASLPLGPVAHAG